jgi:hypothetical protein
VFRWVTHLAAALSLALLLATAVLWVRSHRYSDSIQIITRRGNSWEFYSVGTRPRRLGIERVVHWPESPGVICNTLPINRLSPDRRNYRLAILYYSTFGGAHSRNWQASWIWGSTGELTASVQSDGRIRRLTPNSGFSSTEATSNLSPPLPFWYISANHVLLMLIFSLLPMWVAGSITFRSLRRNHRASLRRCITCGYSLRGNTSGVCPECGAVISTRNG